MRRSWTRRRPALLLLGRWLLAFFLTVAPAALAWSPPAFLARGPRLKIDPRTGYFRPAPNDNDNAKSSGGIGAAWNDLKETVYKGVDRVQQVPKLVKSLNDTIQKATGKEYNVMNSPRDLVGQRPSIGIVDGYSQLYGDQEAAKKKNGPGRQQLMDRRLERNNDNNPLDNIKSALMDAVESANSMQLDDSKVDFKPMRPTEDMSPVMQQAVSEYQTAKNQGNALAMAVAQAKVEALQRDERRQQLALEREFQARQITKAASQWLDGTQTVVEGLVRLPGRLSKFCEQASKWILGLPQWIQQQVDFVLGIPESVEKSINDAASFVSNTVETTKQTAQSIYEFPGKVTESAKEAATNIKEAAYDTQQTAFVIADAVEDAVLAVKAWQQNETVAAAPRPRRRRSRRTTKTLGDVGWQIASGVASAFGRVAWWGLKGTAGLAMTGARRAYEEYHPAFLEAWEEMKPIRGPSIPKIPAFEIPDIELIPDSYATSAFYSEAELRRKPEQPHTQPVTVYEQAKEASRDTAFFIKEINGRERKSTEQLNQDVADALALATEALMQADKTLSGKQLDEKEPSIESSAEEPTVAPGYETFEDAQDDLEAQIAEALFLAKQALRQENETGTIQVLNGRGK